MSKELKGALLVVLGMALFGFTTPVLPPRHITNNGAALSTPGLCSSDGITTNCGTLAAQQDLPLQLFTAPSGAGITSQHNGYVRPFVNSVTYTPAALTAAGTSDITVMALGAGSHVRVTRMVADVTQTFTGGGLASVAVTCGTSAGGNQFLLSFSAFTAPITKGLVLADLGVALAPSTLADFTNWSGGYTIQCRFTCSANCNGATQGSVTMYVEGMQYLP